MKKLKEDLEKAKENNNIVEEERAVLEIHQLEDYLRGAIDKKGKSRKLGGEIEKERKRITNAINRALSNIKKVDNVLYKHLKNSFKTGSVLSYTPEKPMSWEFD
ncbi:MAG: hypothetical protein IIA61_03775 [Candidatus Marinimicrobia bacterium]|nr:hypothetical protein [Candidatus Neomarinimicrobiota bacterium]